jgi:uncharacterized membrane protein YhaH (DUF805 family)
MSGYFDTWRNAFNFTGRARRKEYWTFTLINSFITFILMSFWMSKVFSSNSYDSVFSGPVFSLLALFILLTALPGLAVHIRRLHDIGKPGSWVFIQLVPFVGGIWSLILLATDGSPGPNQWGESPKYTLPFEEEESSNDYF